jgi:hypothetical protein
MSYAPIVIGGAVLGVIAMLLFRPAPRVTPTPATGFAQIDQAMQMLQQQQDINRELLKGQQELNAQLIQAQSRARTVQPSINCFLAVCPGTGRQEAGTDDYAVVGEAIRTARVDPKRMPHWQVPASPATPVHYDPWQEHYRVMAEIHPAMFQGQLNECINANWQLPVDGRLNCPALQQYMGG